MTEQELYQAVADKNQWAALNIDDCRELLGVYEERKDENGQDDI